jgi:hypothetical protein
VAHLRDCPLSREAAAAGSPDPTVEAMAYRHFVDIVTSGDQFKSVVESGNASLDFAPRYLAVISFPLVRTFLAWTASCL